MPTGRNLNDIKASYEKWATGHLVLAAAASLVLGILIGALLF